MRIPVRQRGRGLSFNMTPMIDVVFQLIVFFLAASHLARVETQQELDLPGAASGEREVEQPARRIVVNVLADRTILVGGQARDLNAFRRMLRAEVEATGAEGIEVRIRTDETVPYAAIEPLLLACARAGIWNVTFAVVREEE